MFKAIKFDNTIVKPKPNGNSILDTKSLLQIDNFLEIDSSMDLRVLNFNRSLVNSIHKNVIVAKNSNYILFDYDNIIKDWFSSSTNLMSNIFGINEIINSYITCLSRNIEYCSVSNNVGKATVTMGRSYVEHIVNSIASSTMFNFNDIINTAIEKPAIFTPKQLSLQMSKKLITHLSYVILHETTHIAQNSMEIESDILMNDVISNRTIQVIIAEEAMASFIGVFLNKISKDVTIYHILEYLPINNYDGIDNLKKIRYMGYIIGMMAGRYAIEDLSNDKTILEIKLFFNMLPKSEYGVILENLVKMAKLKRRGLINYNTFLPIGQYVNSLKREH